jgi:hypothetical protein
MSAREGENAELIRLGFDEYVRTGEFDLSRLL